MCVSAGTDIVAIARIAGLLQAHGPRFLNRWFTPLEIGYCMSKNDPSRHLAARLAAKEAVLKALPHWDGPLPWHSIEIFNDEWGAPRIRLHGEFGAAASLSGIRDIQVSISHCDSYATAIALVTPGRTAAPMASEVTRE